MLTCTRQIKLLLSDVFDFFTQYWPKTLLPTSNITTEPNSFIISYRRKNLNVKFCYHPSSHAHKKAFSKIMFQHDFFSGNK